MLWGHNNIYYNAGPINTLAVPHASDINLFISEDRLSAQIKGRLITKLIISVPMVDPRPKLKVYIIPCRGEETVLNTTSINAPLPASP